MKSMFNSQAKHVIIVLSFAFVATVFIQTAFAQAYVARRTAPIDLLEYSAPNGVGYRPSEALRPGGDGDLDPTFSPTFELANGFGNAVEELPNGKILVAGGFKSVNGHSTFSVARFNADRTIDTAFAASMRGSVFRIVPLTDGKILIAGAFTAFSATTSRFGIARLNEDGSLDPTFSTGTGPDGAVRDIVLQPDGKILIVGNFFSVDGSSRWGIARLMADGSLDAGFTSPLTPTGPGSTPAVNGVGLQSDGKVIVGGLVSLDFVTIRSLVRLNSNGSSDGTFSVPSMGSGTVNELAIQPDNKIIVGGIFTSINSTSRPRIARLNADGTLDTGFSTGSGASSTVLQVRYLANGQVIVTGTFGTINGTARGGVALLNSDGSLDLTFAPTGPTTGAVVGAIPTASGFFVTGSFSQISGQVRNTLVAMSPTGGVDPAFVVNSLGFSTVRAIIPQPDGKMLVSGAFNRINGAPSNSIVRLNSNGSVDPTFSNGVSITGSVFRIVVQPDGKLLIMGSNIRINNGAGQALVRLNADGTHDSSFVLGPITVLFGYTAGVQADGKILFSFQTTINPPLFSGFVRLNSNGSIDESFSPHQLPFEAITVLPNGQILAAGPFGFGYVNSTGGTFEPHNAIMRFNSDGSHDRTFQSGLTAENTNVSAAYAMHVQADGKILLGGRLFTGASPTTPVGAVRLNPSGTVDGGFQTNPISINFGIPTVFSLAPTSDNKILISGAFTDYGGPGRTNVARLTANGVIDTSFTAATDTTVSAVTTQQNGAILIGGAFDRVNGQTRVGMARLLSGPARRAPFDFDGDGKTDIGIFRPTDGTWWISRSSNSSTIVAGFGADTDIITPGDYTGDGKADIAFWRPSNGYWFVLRSEDSLFFAFPFGTSGDVPVPADYDNDGKADPAVFRNGVWFILKSTGGVHIEQFGQAGDRPVAADYDGDGRADIAIFRPSDGTWWLNRSTAGLVAFAFGNASDKQVPGDFTGDGKADVAFWRPSNGFWFVLQSEDSAFFAFPFGTNGDIPAPGDYDGDGKFDATIFRPSQGTWYSNRSTAGVLIQQFGADGDRPVPNAFVP